MSLGRILAVLFITVSYFRALDRNEYNHITATYFLLAERKLRSQRQEIQQNKTRLDLSLSLTSAAESAR